MNTLCNPALNLFIGVRRATKSAISCLSKKISPTANANARWVGRFMFVDHLLDSGFAL
ncbi:MAG: hypothetical protein WCF03_06075 [Nitrososphaeraceae archaeon]